ncbi:hypothetical protein [Brachybacterium sp. J153]|uniref:hypothetical protein n=1 Tax=Brachybacterium sp. J153 TaxID=3116488 RepID=UPI002E79EB15|nr:hypothetical protein [Brachybacterium sp. J153]MEE1619575.1 hypothetical protein [Brachybacterium sp. J153]
MTGFLGADTDEVRRIGGDIATGAGRIDALAERLTAVLAAVAWVGPDADALRADWALQVRPALVERGEALRRDSRELTDHADEQDDASSPLSAQPAVQPLAVKLVAAIAPLAPAEPTAPGPPPTERTVTIGPDHELAPGDDDEPFGIGVELAPSTTYEVGDHGTFHTDETGAVVYVQAEGGGERMNPNLRETFPDAVYHVNDLAYYRTDELGRTEHLFVPEVIVDRDMERSQSIQSTIAERWDMAGDGTSEPVEYNAGHVLARQLGGIREEINYTRQWDEVNQSRSGVENIYSVESLLADGVTEDGRSYSYETEIHWGEEQPAGVGPEFDSEPWEYVPESYDVTVTEDGEEIVDLHLPNYPDGARFPE